MGGGDCGIAEEVLKHKSVKRLTQVEIDASVVEFSKEHFPEFTRPVLDNARFDLVIDDGMNYVARPSGASMSSSSIPPIRKARARSCSARNSIAPAGAA